MWRFGILILFCNFLFLGAQVCFILQICDSIEEVKSEVAAVREDQKMISENQTLILENQSDLLTRKMEILDYQFQILYTLKPSEHKSYPSSCADVSRETKLLIRVPKYSQTPFEVACDQRSHGGGWTIILRRNDGSEDFYRGWEDYKRGFGQLSNEFFLGLDRIHAMTSVEPHEMLVLLEDHDGVKAYELYDAFKVGPESNNYTLKSLGFASGDAGNSLARQLGMMFSTKDRNNDLKTDGVACAEQYTGAWWYEKCHTSNLCGKYGDNTPGKGVTWISFRGQEYSLKRAVMMIRPRNAALN